jgi:hypothetical protein
MPLVFFFREIVFYLGGGGGFLAKVLNWIRKTCVQDGAG